MLFIQDGSVAQTVNQAAAKFTGFTGAGTAVGVVPSLEGSSIRIDNAGPYVVLAALSLKGTDARTVSLRLRRNSVEVDGLRGDATLAGDSKTIAIALCGQLGCSQGDVLELYAEADADGTSVTPVSGTFAVTRI